MKTNAILTSLWFPALLLAALPSGARAQTAGPKNPRPLPYLEDATTKTAPVAEVAPSVIVSTPAGGSALGGPLHKPASGSTLPLTGTRRIDHERLSFDSPDDDGADGPDGPDALWVRGRNWKASFSRSGTTYVPFFGSSAPRNFPITFRVAGVRVGTQPISLASSAPAERSGERVAFDRTGVVERYDLSPASIEQSFVFETLPATGELVVRIDVETELAAAPHAGGLRFSNELGHVDYGRPTVIDAAGRTRALDLALDVADGMRTIELRVPADFVAEAVLPITIDPVIVTYSLETSIDQSFHPDTAYDATNDHWLAVFEEIYSASDHDVYALLLDGGGVFIAVDTIDYTTDSWEKPSVANNNLANQFLVAAQVKFPGEIEPLTIRGRTASAVDLVMGAQFTISGAEQGLKGNCDVGGDPALVGPTHYCVVWERIFSDSDRDIHYRLVHSSGQLVGPSTQNADNSASTVDRQPSVSKSNGGAPFDTQEWNVVWNREFGIGVRDIRGAQIHWDGFLTTPSFPIDTSANDDSFPVCSSPLDAASGPRPWLVVFSRAVSGTSDLLAYVYQGSTLVVPANLSILEGNAGSGTVDEYQFDASADSDGPRFVVAYAETQGSTSLVDLKLASLELDAGALKLVESHLDLGSTAEYEHQPEVASTYSSGGTRGRFAAVWTRNFNLPDDGDIEGAIYAIPSFQTLCYPGQDAIACPCGNDPADGTRGCENSAGTGGAFLGAQGDTEDDDVLLVAASVLPTPTCVFLQGNAITVGGAAFGDGVRCVGGSLKRLYVKNAAGGIAAAPTGLEPSIQTRSAALGDLITPGSTRYYQVYYRDPVEFACVSPSTFNITNALSVHW